MDPQEQLLFEQQEAQISALTARVADLEQKLAHLADWMRGVGDHVGFDHPGFDRP